jgi:hypothetical protein
MISKIVFFTLAITVASCFYLQSQKIHDLENKVELIESDIEDINENLMRVNKIFIIIIDEIKRQRSYTIAQNQ